jgi:hypothetical protein
MAARRVTVLLLSVAIAAPVVAWQAASAPQVPPSPSPAPLIQNGRMETRTGAAIDREIAAVSSVKSSDPVWVAWRVPMIDGDRDMCSWYGDRNGSVRGMFVEDVNVAVVAETGGRAERPVITAPTGPIPLEGGTHLVVLARVVGGESGQGPRVERLRTAGDDCPMDAGGRTVYWLSGITPAESLRYLGGLAQAGPADESPADLDRRVAESAVRAMGYHRDAAADGALDRIALTHRNASMRRQAASTLASLRGAHGVATITRMIGATKDESERRSLTSALGQSRDASVVPALRTLARDPDARVRAEAGYWFVLRGGTAVIPEALQLIAGDTDDAVHRRLVSALGRLPGDTGVPSLLQLARTTTNSVVRREAVAALSRSKDSRAVAYMEEILKK